MQLVPIFILVCHLSPTAEMFRKLDTEKTGTIELNLVNVSSLGSKAFVFNFFGGAGEGVNSRDCPALFWLIMAGYMYSRICWIYIACIFISRLNKGYPSFKKYTYNTLHSLTNKAT